MKTFLVVAGLLMTGASVYGIVDYNKKAESKEFKDLYKESPAPVETKFVKEATVIPVAEKKELAPIKAETAPVKKATRKKASKKKEREFKFAEFSRSKLG